MDRDNEATLDEFTIFLGKLLDIEVNFPIIERRAEQYFDPKPAVLARSDEDGAKLRTAMHKLAESLGGLPEHEKLSSEDQKSIIYDTFPNSILSEITLTFWKTRKAICRAHLSYIAGQTFLKDPDFMNCSKSERDLIYPAIAKRYWEQVEYAYVRLASYWDRVGQLLDFVYFHIRQYENDGFSSVIEKIQNNMCRCYPQIRESQSFANLLSFKRSEKENGIGWLLKRRNILIHRVGFSAKEKRLECTRNWEDETEKPTVIFLFNHLAAAQDNRLRQDDQTTELQLLHSQLTTICELFPDVISVAQLGAKLIPRPLM